MLQELAIIHGRQRMSTVICKETCEFLSISAQVCYTTLRLLQTQGVSAFIYIYMLNCNSKTRRYHVLIMTTSDRRTYNSYAPITILRACPFLEHFGIKALLNNVSNVPLASRSLLLYSRNRS